MASRQNYSSSSQMVNNQTGSSSTSSVKEKSSHNSNKTESSKLKHGKVIHKFTSESYLRLICEKSSSPNVSSSNNDEKNFIDKSSSSSTSSGHIPLSSNTIINNMSNKRKGTSFQITSVSVSSANPHHSSQQAQRNSTTDNNGDDSADDLDDSHTDDNISRITDYETPSISETFSGEDVFFAQQNAFGTAPVIPTSSQYGLAIVGPPDLGCGNGTNLTDVHVSVTDAGINIMGPISSKQDADHKNERFKVVKIESTEPFKRGRWMCMDYLDHTTLQDDGIDGKEGDENVTKDDDQHKITVGPKVLIVNNGEIEHTVSDNEELDHEVNKINSLKQEIQHNSQQHHITASHPQTMTTIPTFIDHSPNSIVNHNQAPAQSLPVGQIEKIIIQEKQLTLNLQDNNNSTGIATNNSEMLPQSIIHENNATSNIPNNIVLQQQSNVLHQHAQTMTQEMIHSMMHQQDQQLHNIHQGATLPTNILMQNIGHEHLNNLQQQMQQQSQLNSPNSSNALPLSSNQHIPIPTHVTENASSNAEIEFSSSNNHSNNNINNNSSNSNNNNQDPMTSQFQASQIVVTGDRIQSESDNQQTGNLVTNENLNSISNNNNSNNNGDNITVSNDGTQQNISSPSSSAGTIVVEGAVSNDVNENTSNSVNSGNNNSGGNATVVGADDGQAISEDNESASGTSAVAIDNKIEQAMDLVKSHLMFAVREEVEVLKEKIAELMDRINQLEVENTILKANASQETLSQLTTAAPVSTQQQQQQQTASPVVSQNPPSQPTQQPQITQASPNTQNQAAS